MNTSGPFLFAWTRRHTQTRGAAEGSGTEEGVSLSLGSGGGTWWNWNSLFFGHLSFLTHTHALLYLHPPLLFTCHSNCSFNYSVLFESLTLSLCSQAGMFFTRGSRCFECMLSSAEAVKLWISNFSKLRFRCILMAYSCNSALITY